jgi:hypothetical protein
LRRARAATLTYRITRIGITWSGLSAAAAALARCIAGISIRDPRIPPATARLITRVGIRGAGLPAPAAPPARLIAWVGICGFQRTTTARRAAAIAGFIARIGIGFAAAARFRARLVLAGQIRLSGGG